MHRHLLTILYIIATLFVGACGLETDTADFNQDTDPQSARLSADPSSVLVAVVVIGEDGEPYRDASGQPEVYLGSGTVIGPRHVLTTAHTLPVVEPPQKGYIVDVFPDKLGIDGGPGMHVRQVEFHPGVVHEDVTESTDVAILITEDDFDANQIASLEFAEPLLPAPDEPWPCLFEIVSYGQALTDQSRKRTSGALCLTPTAFVESERHREMAEDYIQNKYDVDVSKTIVERPGVHLLPFVALNSPYIESYTLPFAAPFDPAMPCHGSSGGGIYRMANGAVGRALVGMYHGVWWPFVGLDSNGQKVEIESTCERENNGYTVHWYSSLHNYQDFITDVLDRF
jgi:hypothetical protein